jgi:glycosyltransferase involved in cell wall biosynthesis
MIRVAAFAGGRTVPSARFRVSQLVAPLRAHGIAMTPCLARFGTYPPRARLARPFWLAATLADRLPDVLRSHRFDVTFLQRELVSTLETWERLTRRPRVLDVDDAVWLHRGGGFIRRIARRCDAVICGNAFLAEYFAGVLRAVHVVPTAVDTARFTPRGGPRTDAIIGWSGSASGLPYLHAIEDALAAVLEARPAARLRVVCDAAPRFGRLPPGRVEFVPWSPHTEVTALQDLAVGLMPLPDTDWERGKCSFKMLLYMACGVPVVVSPVGMNREVLGLGRVGLAAGEPGAWVDAIVGVLDDPPMAAAMGAEGRRVVERHFAVDRIAAQVAAVLHGVAGTGLAERQLGGRDGN